jgi:hypothetical protein
MRTITVKEFVGKIGYTKMYEVVPESESTGFIIIEPNTEYSEKVYIRNIN